MKSLIRKLFPEFLISFYHYLLALAGAFYYNFPSRNLIVIGITGTKGKSTTAMMLGRIFEETGKKVAWLTSATIKIKDKEILNPYHMTMPGRFAVQRFLREAADNKCKYAILEVTSEGIKQHRHRFINFNTAVFTNLRPEHIEAHGSFENYRYCKGLLFKATKKFHVINLDDKNADYFLQFKAKEKLGYGLNGSDKKDGKIGILKATNCKVLSHGTKFDIDNIEFDLGLLGEFNVYNALAAIAAALLQKVGLKDCKKALEKINKIPGRMEVIAERPFKIIVDLAHTPDSYEEVFKAVKSLNHNKIISIFGSAGGGRDKWKRPVLGKIAAGYSDYIILCNEDPYDEEPGEILSEIESGVVGAGFKKENLYKILDRKEAIKKGLGLAKEGDIMLLLGKGTEQLMFVGRQKIKWDDREIVAKELALII